MNKEIIYYRLKLKLTSPLAVGSGEDRNSDSDIMLDSLGKPVIPAASIAGAVRHYLGVEYKDKSDFFGYIDNVESSDSKIKFYDAVMTEEKNITVRDSVALEDKVGKNGAKFDKEVLETDAEFVTLIEIHDASEKENSDILDVLSALHAGHLRIGSKTTRGYGQFEITKAEKAYFSLPNDRKRWLDFYPYDYESTNQYTDITGEIVSRETNKRFTRIHLELKQNGAISIRSYTVKNADDISSADYVQLSVGDTPVIPGTSWAGAFRQRFEEFCNHDKKFMNDIWGFVSEKEKTQAKSKIIFSESQIRNATPKIITRNSIDRFSAGTKDGALYTEKTYYNGECALDIDINNDVEDMRRCIEILSAVICDLDNGYLAVGGLTAVGRGLFSVKKMLINEKDVTKALKEMNLSEIAEE